MAGYVDQNVFTQIKLMVTTLMWDLKQLSSPVITGGQSAASIAFSASSGRPAPAANQPASQLGSQHQTTLYMYN